ncbi:hypothetical protein E6B08_24795 [Pseudomonas putida]|uniref:Uncharacterized protein n=1 Tax=Pseudomonas putida TaxID=303 RepID=A0A4D6XFH4_PSEPU|nr:hypothetical protein E6B08_24795 [Pseudomonas putida]
MTSRSKPRGPRRPGLRRRSRSSSDARGAALRPIRGTSPLPQDNYRPQAQRCTCGSGLVPRMGCKAAPIT